MKHAQAGKQKIVELFHVYSISSLLTEGVRRLGDTRSRRADAKILLKHALGLNDVDLLLNPERTVGASEARKYFALTERRASGEPIAYITGACWFMDLIFYVNNDVLIPRPETELLTETAIKFIKKHNYRKILEIGSGCGCVSISIAAAVPSAYITASDISKKALEVASFNLLMNSDLSISFLRSDLFKSIEKEEFDVIISNPPYIKTGEIETLEDGVKLFEPRLALDGGPDGLYFYREIINNARIFLKTGGMIFFEIGFDQGDEVLEILKANNFTDINIIKDYAGYDRIAHARKGELDV